MSTYGYTCRGSIATITISILREHSINLLDYYLEIA